MAGAILELMSVRNLRVKEMFTSPFLDVPNLCLFRAKPRHSSKAALLILNLIRERERERLLRVLPGWIGSNTCNFCPCP